MPTVHPFAARKNWRIRYIIDLRGKKKRKAKYAPTKAEAQVLANRLSAVEQATRTGIARHEDIEEWIDRGWLDVREADQIFIGYQESTERARRTEAQSTNYAEILKAYEQYSLDTTKDEVYGRSHLTNMGRARRTIDWLRANYRQLEDLEISGAEQFRSYLRAEGYAPWTVFHYLTCMRLLLDQAQRMHMIRSNPARELSLRQPKKLEERRILSREEARWALDTSPEHRQWINGSVPTIVRLGLYAGLRNQEMCWLQWDRIDWSRRIVTIGATTCEETGETWTPKDFEVRHLDINPTLVDYLRAEQKRQQKAGILGPFVMPGGGARRPEWKNRPLSPDAPQKAWLKMLDAEKKKATKEKGRSNLLEGITVYSFRHTYCTMLLRKEKDGGAGLDSRTVQQRMGHASLKTTEEYLHYIEPEDHPTDRLQY